MTVPKGCSTSSPCCRIAYGSRRAAAAQLRAHAAHAPIAGHADPVRSWSSASIDPLHLSCRIGKCCDRNNGVSKAELGVLTRGVAFVTVLDQYSRRHLRSEGDINEVVAGLEGVGREEASGAGAAVSIDAGIRGRSQRAVGIVGGEVVSGVRVSSSRMVGGNIGGAGRYGHRRGECHRLPTACTRVAEGSGGKQRAR